MNQNYAPNNKFLWDSWFIKEEDTYHVFYLQANKTQDSELRHNNNVSIGHAISKDLINWEELPVALEPGVLDEDWDNLSLWTGCVYKKDNLYYMFYTGRSKNEHEMWIQKIGLATSQDLINWTKYEHNPLLEAKEYYYIDNEKNTLGKIGAFRDPDIFYDKTYQKYFMLISARENSIDLENKTREYNGCIALL
ncbi:MAG: family 43 glycosylhydrolase [Nanoarchaeota archaeon]|nr:family 43 glycosylhydrolase [Nanoarchaeota archaeon]